MNSIAVLLVLVLCACVVNGSPAATRRDHRRVLVNRPSTKEMFHSRVRRGQPLTDAEIADRPLLSNGERLVLKGEYMCGNKVCRLTPGEVPHHCIGCQYPIKG